MIDPPEALEEFGVPAAQIDANDLAIHTQIKDHGPARTFSPVPSTSKTPNRGDALEVRIEAARLVVPYALNLFMPGLGTLPEDFPYLHQKLIPLDLNREVARCSRWRTPMRDRATER